MLNSLDDALGFQPPPPIYSEIANIVKGAKKIISNFFALKLYISWEAGTPKKLQDLLQQCWRLDKSTVTEHPRASTEHPRSSVSTQAAFQRKRYPILISDDFRIVANPNPTLGYWI